MLPVTVDGAGSARSMGARAGAQPELATRKRAAAAAAGGVIEIDLPLGRVRLTGAVDLAALRVVIEALSQR